MHIRSSHEQPEATRSSELSLYPRILTIPYTSHLVPYTSYLMPSTLKYIQISVFYKEIKNLKMS